MSNRPISLQSALALRRAQAAREHASTVVAPAPRRTGFSLARIFGAKAADVGTVDDMEPRKLAA